jgi:hypothetical protein
MGNRVDWSEISSPVESVVELYEAGRDIGKILDETKAHFEWSDTCGWDYNTVKNYLVIYRYLKANGRYHAPADIELYDPDEDDSEQSNTSEDTRAAEKYREEYEEEESSEDYSDETPDESSEESSLLEDFYEKLATEYSDATLERYKRGLEKVLDDLSMSFDDFMDKAKMLLPDYCRGGKKQRIGRMYSGTALRCVKKVVDFAEEAEAKKNARPEPTLSESEIVSDPSKSFQAMKRAVTVVAKKVGKALIISGNGGIGKSYAVNNVLEAYGHSRPEDYNILKTKCTPINMYKFLYRNRDKICVFDDCDSILQNVEGRSILKSALDSDSVREVFWNSDACDVVDTTSCMDNNEVAAVLANWSKRHNERQGTPNHFFFNGSVIIISNMKKDDIKKLDEALVTRCHTVEVSLSNQEILDRLEGLLDDFKIYDADNRDITDDDMKRKVFDWISSEEFLNDERMEGKTLNFRLFVNTYKALYANGDDTDDWKQVAFQG